MASEAAAHWHLRGTQLHLPLSCHDRYPGEVAGEIEALIVVEADEALVLQALRPHAAEGVKCVAINILPCFLPKIIVVIHAVDFDNFNSLPI